MVDEITILFQTYFTTLMDKKFQNGYKEGVCSQMEKSEHPKEKITS